MKNDQTKPLLGVLKKLPIQYVYAYTPDEYAYALRLFAEGEVDAATFVTGHVDLDGVAQALSDLADPERHMKIV